MKLYYYLNFLLKLSIWIPVKSFILLPQYDLSNSFGNRQSPPCTQCFATNHDSERIIAVLAGPPISSDQEKDDIISAMKTVGKFTSIVMEDGIDKYEASIIYKYKFIKATGMLKLVDSIYPNAKHKDEVNDAPRWIPIQAGEENFLVSRGWSFLDPDESEPASPFDIDAANKEGLYKPKWGMDQGDDHDFQIKLSSLGFSLLQPTHSEMDYAINNLKDDTKKVLLYGGTDPPGLKQTHNGFDFSGPTGFKDITPGIFLNPISNIPLFSTVHLSPTTASSGWLSFSKAIAHDHVKLIYPEKDDIDSRVEVICAKTNCHLGHYFGKSDGYCINAGALNFMPFHELTMKEKEKHLGAFINSSLVTAPVSWRPFDNYDVLEAPMKMLYSILHSNSKIETITLGAGCFWHVEYALRRLPGVISTKVGYAGGMNEFNTSTNTPIPITYEKVCKGNTGFAEVVQLAIDIETCDPEILFECFLSLHDPTKVRAHGKHERKVGQYRSCIFVSSETMMTTATAILDNCRDQLQKELSTDIEFIHSEEKYWFWSAEDRHQLHDQRVKKDYETYTLTLKDWLNKFGRRSASILGSSITQTKIDDSDANDDSFPQLKHTNEDEYEDYDDGMARMMI